MKQVLIALAFTALAFVVTFAIAWAVSWLARKRDDRDKRRRG